MSKKTAGSLAGAGLHHRGLDLHSFEIPRRIVFFSLFFVETSGTEILTIEY